MVKWTKHSRRRYHQTIPYAHMLKETRVWLKIVINYLISGIHYTDITRDKAQVHKGHKYAFSGLITRMCRAAGIPKKNVDYMTPLFPAPVDITRTKGPDTEFVPTLTTTERHRRDELIMVRMYDLKMLRHQNGCLASTAMQLGDVERRFPLNAQAKALLGIGPEFRELVDDEILTNEERFHTSSDVESDEEDDPAQAGDKVEGGDSMED
ncbi:hypothetical protein H5410_022229 [Solanum commersonii]|uniref:Uncharacterized protein n=1 Tax=Solanum commersonii TaxID=4109 RepID=A0A9J5ZHG2_SOLCO|nr:hypothetical protein H5410_022229 [Solanum commersonii]